VTLTEPLAADRDQFIDRQTAELAQDTISQVPPNYGDSSHPRPRIRAVGEPLTCYFSVQLRGFEPLTPSMRTEGIPPQQP